MEARYYETSQGARKGQQGIEFEKDISTLSLKNLLEADLQDFLLGREKKGVGKFDDICVVYEKIAKKVVILAQLKHKEDENEKISYEALSKNRSNDFFLPKYFESLEQIEKSLEEDEAFKGTNSNILFICTNIGMEDDLKGIEKEQVHDDSVLLKEWGKQIKLRITDKQLKKEIFQQSYKSKRKRLAEEMVNSLMHQKTIDIPSMIKNEVVSLFKDYHKPLAEYVIDGSTGRLKSEFLNPSKDEVKNLRDCFYVTLEEFCNKYGSKNVEELKSEFSIRDKEAQELRRRLEDYRSRASTETFLESHRFKKPNFCCKVSGEIASRETLPPNENIDDNKIDLRIDEFLDKLIFVTNLRDVKGEIKRNILPSIYIKLRERIDQWFDDVTKKTYKEEKMQRMWLGKKELLSKALEMNVSFQGIRIKLNQLLGGNQNLLTSDLLLCVFGSQENQDLDISVGRSPEQTSEMNYYVSRKISRKLQNEVEERFTEKDLMQKELASRILTIVGEPGMGKTTFLQSIASKFVQSVDMNKRPTWIIFVPLITCKNSIKDLDTENLEQIIGFFSHLENCKDEFSETLLKDFIMGKGEMKIILDGLDELSVLEQDQIIDLVQVIVKKTHVDQVWLTARTHLKQKLKENFKEVSFTLDELKGNDQVNLLVKYWKYTSPHLEETYLNNFAHKLIEKINLHIDTKWQAFLGIPLQAYLIAFVFQGEIMKENLKTPDSLTLISLYDRFVEEKYNVYFRKFGQDIQEEIKEDLKENWNKCYASLALSCILKSLPISYSQEDINTWFNFDCISIKVDNFIKIGIVYKKEGTIYFIHQTFVEYFVAKLFAEVCHRKRVCQSQEKCIELVTKVLYPDIFRLPSYLFNGQPNFNSFIYVLFDLKISENSSLHFAVLNGEKETVEQFSEREINTKDCLGRTALYYALCYNQYNILKILFQKKIHVDLSDKYFIFSWYLIVWFCLDWFYFYFSDWPTNVFSRLALQVEIALQIDQKRNVVIDDTTHYFNPFTDIDVGDLFTNHGIRKAAINQIIDAKTILKEINIDKIKAKGLAEQFELLKYKKIPLIEAHRYFNKNSEFLLNAEEIELQGFFDSSDFLAYSDVLRMSIITTRKVTANLILFQIPFKKYFPVVDEVTKRCKNVFLIFEKFISLKIQIVKASSDSVCSSINGAFQNHLFKVSKNTVKCSLQDEVGKLKEKVDQGYFTGLWIEIINNIWAAGCKYDIPDFANNSFQNAVLEVIKRTVISTKLSKLFNLYGDLTIAIFCFDKPKVRDLLQEADERGLLKLLLNARFDEGDTFEDFALKVQPAVKNEYYSDKILLKEIHALLIEGRKKFQRQEKRDQRKKRRRKFNRYYRPTFGNKYALSW